MPRTFRIGHLVTAAVVLYLLSLVLTVFYTRAGAPGYWDEGPTWYGVEVLMLGWIAALGAPEAFRYWSIAWFANPLFVLTTILVVRNRASGLPVAIMGLLLGLSTLFFRRIWNDKEPPTIEVTSYGLGFYLWLAALLLMVLVAWKVKKGQGAGGG